MASGIDGSILITIKKTLGIDANYNAFDVDIITHINSALMTLQQLGVGPEEGFLITGTDQKWSDFFPTESMLQAAKTYVYLCVKMVFDPPTNSFVVTAIKEERTMLENRLKEQARFFNSTAGKYVTPTWKEDEDPEEESGDD